MTNQTQDKPTEKKLTIRDYLESDVFVKQVANALPDGMSPARFVQSAVTAIIRNRKLLECTRDSLFKCLMDLSSLGLEPDGRRAHLIPFRDNKLNTTLCTLVVDYKGIAECVRRNGDVATIHCDVVGNNDKFICRYGTNAELDHVPSIVDRGKIYAVYSFVTLKTGEKEWDVMSVAEVEAVRAKSRGKDSVPWTEHWNEMAKKTVFRRHSKTLPLSPETRRAVEYGEDEEFAFAKAVPAIVPGLPSENDMVDLGQPEMPESAPAREPAPPKEAKAPARAQKPAEPAPAAKKSAQTPPKELFGDDPEADTDADKLIVALHRDSIKWESFCRWIASTGALGQNVTDTVPVSQLDPSLLADCIQNYAANIEEFRRWEASSAQ